jgi:hypothetical protein
VSWLWLPFKIGELALASFQNRQNSFGELSKALGAATVREIFYPIGAKDLNSPVLKSFSQIQKVFALNGKEFINSI